MNKSKKTKAAWLKARHRAVRNIAYVLMYPYTRIKYGITVEKFKAQGKRPYLILYNHQTLFDQFFVGMSFRGAIYYLASEDIFSNGFISSLLRWLVAPISIKKQTMDIGAIKNCLQVAREGGTIAIAPEGNRTYSGRTEHMSPSIAPLAKRLGLPIALYRIEGGYGVHPRWSNVVRRGKMRAYVARVIEPEEYAQLSNDELFALIKEGLEVNEACADGIFEHSKRAEYIERVLYVCPFCGLSSFESHGAIFECKKCGRRIEYGKNKELSGIDFDLPFRFVGEWYDYQNEFILKLNPNEYEDATLYCDRASFSEVMAGRRKVLIHKNAELCLCGNKITVGGEDGAAFEMSFEDIHSMAVLGRNKLNVYHGEKIYQIKGSDRFNAVKYVNIFYRAKNLKHGEGNDKFLGL